MKDIDAVVIGGGPAGLMAAGRASELGKRVVLVEKNDRLGRKLALTGKGRCNITNACDPEEFFANIPVNSRFLYSAFYSFTNFDTIAFFEKFGVKTKVERGNRVFPESEKAADVINALKRYISNVEVRRGIAKRLIIEDSAIAGVVLNHGERIYAKSVLVATGGASYPQTGSTGDGYRLAKQAGHSITELKPSLVPLVASDDWVPELQGLSLKNVKITVFDKDRPDKKIYEDFGEMLFTHYGLSGPIILSASSHMRTAANYVVSLDLKPALDKKQLDGRVLRNFEKFSRKHFENSLFELLPKKLVPVIVRLSQIPPEKEVNSVTRKEREGLVKVLKDLRVNIKGFRPIEEAIVTSGGICVREINPSTMESKLVRGLFFAGEIIDVDAYTGGFNLQIAFSTGHLAGENI